MTNKMKHLEKVKQLNNKHKLDKELREKAWELADENFKRSFKKEEMSDGQWEALIRYLAPPSEVITVKEEGYSWYEILIGWMFAACWAGFIFWLVMSLMHHFIPWLVKI